MCLHQPVHAHMCVNVCVSHGAVSFAGGPAASNTASYVAAQLVTEILLDCRR